MLISSLNLPFYNIKREDQNMIQFLFCGIRTIFEDKLGIPDKNIESLGGYNTQYIHENVKKMKQSPLSDTQA